MFKEAVVTYLKVLYQYLPAMTVRKMKAVQDKQTLGQNIEHC
jgi:hypothetical protein